MLTSVNWLNQLLEPGDLSADEIDEILTHAGFPIEGREALPGGDIRLDIEMTSNRGDCLCHFGQAREIAASTGRILKRPDPQLTTVSESVSGVTSVDNQVPDVCPRFTARLIRGVKVGPSPEWLRTALESIGQQSINNVVDVSNYVLWEIGHPNHVFDLDTLAGKRLIVRRAGKGEKIIALDKEEYKLRETDLVVADQDRAMSIAGVIGGLDSGVTEKTTNVLLEVATWHPVTVRSTARRLGITTDAVYRFERFVDPRDIEWASRRCAELIAAVAGGEILDGMIDEGSPTPPKTKVTLRSERAAKVIGIAPPAPEMADMLRRLEIEVEESGGSLSCAVPHHRHDITREVDLIEEVARVQGFEKIEVAPVLDVHLELDHPEHWAASEGTASAIARTLTGLGFYETVTFSFLPEKEAAPFLPPELRLLKVDEARRPGGPFLRPSVIPSLLDCRRGNQDARVELPGGVRLFETASVFAEINDGDKHGRQTIENRNLALLMDAPSEVGASELVLQTAIRSVRGAIESVVRMVGGGAVKVDVEQTDKAFFPILADEVKATVSINGEHSGYIALLTGAALKQWGIERPMAIAEVSIKALNDLYPPVGSAHALPLFPEIGRDISLIVGEQTAWSEIESVIRATSVDLLVGHEFVGVFRGKQIGEGQKSVTIRFLFRHPDRTLRHEEVDPQIKALVSTLIAKTGGTIRS